MLTAFVRSGAASVKTADYHPAARMSGHCPQHQCFLK